MCTLFPSIHCLFTVIPTTARNDTKCKKIFFASAVQLIHYFFSTSLFLSPFSLSSFQHSTHSPLYLLHPLLPLSATFPFSGIFIIQISSGVGGFIVLVVLLVVMICCVRGCVQHCAKQKKPKGELQGVACKHLV